MYFSLIISSIRHQTIPYIFLFSCFFSLYFHFSAPLSLQIQSKYCHCVFCVRDIFLVLPNHQKNFEFFCCRQSDCNEMDMWSLRVMEWEGWGCLICRLQNITIQPMAMNQFVLYLLFVFLSLRAVHLPVPIRASVTISTWNRKRSWTTRPAGPVAAYTTFFLYSPNTHTHIYLFPSLFTITILICL